ncbi:unnamed protein product [Porites evermanni]|uniref:Uncharacterized protein n=1 Tax=Porites evermanni TaxID=104178 RepID=A0ABN8PIY3_9CNID|nr:unnamed protein product [Porites evermanni]
MTLSLNSRSNAPLYFSVVKEDGPQPVRERLDEGLAREGPEQLTNADDAPAAHLPGRTSHGEGFAEKGADASGAEPTKEASVIEVDTSVDDEHIATAIHKTNEAICLSCKSEIPAAILKVQRQVEDKYLHVFSFTKASILCRACKIKFSAMHKVVLNNIRQHVDSRGHKEKIRKTMAASSKDIS